MTDAQRVFSLAMLIFLLIGLTACSLFMSGDHRMYEGPQLPIDRVAILLPAVAKDNPLILHKIDGVEGPADLGWSSSFNGSFTIELLPGEHTLTFDYHSYDVDSSGTTIVNSEKGQSVTFTAEPGKLYKAAAAFGAGIWKPVVNEVGPIPPDFVRPQKKP